MHFSRTRCKESAIHERRLGGEEEKGGGEEEEGGQALTPNRKKVRLVWEEGWEEPRHTVWEGGRGEEEEREVRENLATDGHEP